MRFHLIGTQIFEMLDNGSLAKCRIVDRSWNTFVNDLKSAWIRKISFCSFCANEPWAGILNCTILHCTRVHYIFLFLTAFPPIYRVWCAKTVQLNRVYTFKGLNCTILYCTRFHYIFLSLTAFPPIYSVKMQRTPATE